VSAPDHESGPTEQCSEFGSPVDFEPPPDPGTAPYTNFTAVKALKGKNHRVLLGWDGGGPTVDVKLNGSTIATVSNSGSYTHNVGKTPSGPYPYQVCNAGTDTCTLVKTVNYP